MAPSIDRAVTTSFITQSEVFKSVHEHQIFPDRKRSRIATQPFSKHKRSLDHSKMENNAVEPEIV